jgi:hypothetical protein
VKGKRKERRESAATRGHLASIVLIASPAAGTHVITGLRKRKTGGLTCTARRYDPHSLLAFTVTAYKKTYLANAFPLILVTRADSELHWQ